MFKKVDLFNNWEERKISYDAFKYSRIRYILNLHLNAWAKLMRGSYSSPKSQLAGSLIYV